MMVSLVPVPTSTKHSRLVYLPTVCTGGDTDGHPLAVGSLVILWCFSVFPRARRACSAWYTYLTPSTQLNGWGLMSQDFLSLIPSPLMIIFRFTTIISIHFVINSSCPKTILEPLPRL
jgi:hypothetical protein